jgi:hypothetical protein
LSPPTSRHVNSLRIVLPNGDPDRKWTPALHQCFHASVQFRIQRLSREPFCKNRQRDGWERRLILAQDGLVFTNSWRWLRGYLVLGLLDLGPSVFGFARQHLQVLQDQCFAAAVRMPKAVELVVFGVHTALQEKCSSQLSSLMCC